MALRGCHFVCPKTENEQFTPFSVVGTKSIQIQVNLFNCFGQMATMNRKKINWSKTLQNNYICFKRVSRASLSVKNTKTLTAYKNTLENKQIMCRLYRDHTTVLFAGEYTYLLKRAIACKMVERAGFIVGFAQNERAQTTRTEDTTRKRST